MKINLLTGIYRIFLTMVSVLFLFTGYNGLAQEDSQWHGPDRSGIYAESSLLGVWPEGGPELLWSADGLGKGFSSAAVTDNAIYVTGLKDKMDYISRLNLHGEILWTVPFGRSWTATFPDTRTTPTIEGNRIYVLSGSGEIACLDTETGNQIWGFDATGKFDGKWGEWGICESLILVGDKVIFSPAGPRTTLVALDKMTGETIWESPSLKDSGAYVSPVLMELAGKQVIVTTIARHLLGVDASNGEILFRYDYASLEPEKSLLVWPGAPFTNTITPLISGNRIYITGGYNHVGAMFEVPDDGSRIDLIWTDHTLDCHHGGVVLMNGYIYGSNWINNRNGNWCCISWETGETAWEEEWYTKGSIIAADGMLYIYEEKDGHVGLLKPTPEQFDLVSSFQITEGKGPYWAHPVIRDGVLYIRHGESLMAFDIREI